MAALALSFALVALQQAEDRNQAKWTAFYLDSARQYEVTPTAGGPVVPLVDHAVFDWSSIDEFNGAVFAWTENGRPALLATIFSFPRSGTNRRMVVHEFASFAESEMAVTGKSGIDWKPPPLAMMQPVPDAAPPPDSANLLKLQCRRLAKEFSAHMNRRGERWDLRLLPTPLIEFQKLGSGIMGGGLFAFVGYSTDPEILLLLEARESATGAAWHFQPVRFSDKSLYLKHKEKPIWESLRAGHGSEGADSDDPLYRVLYSADLSPEIVEQLSSKANE